VGEGGIALYFLLEVLVCCLFSYLRIENAEGYVLIAVYLFIYLYACYSLK